VVPEPSRRAGPSRRVLIAAALTTVLAIAALVLVSRDDSRAQDDEQHREGLSHYTVREGDTLTSVAELHGLEVEALLDALDLTLADSLEPGDVIDIPELSSEGHEWPRRLVDDPLRAQQNQYFERYAREYDVPTSLLQSLAWVVSSWDNASVNEGEGDLGIGRIDTDLVGWINAELIPGDEIVDPRSPEGNVELTAALLGHLLEVTGGDHANAIATYYLDRTEPSAAAWELTLRNFVTSVLVRVPAFESTPPPSATTTTTTTAPED
jgi:Transglycosylase SLT domain/LysM domain